MNIFVVLGVAASALLAIWVVQSIALKLAGEPLAWPLRFTTRRPLVRWTGRVMIQVAWLIILIGTPLALGLHPLDFVRRAFRTPVPWRDMAIAFSLTFLPYVVICALYIKAGWVRIEPRFDRVTRRGKLFRRFLTPIALATVEESVFRGILLEQILQSLPPSDLSTAFAVMLSSAAFSAVHFIKPSYPGKPIWQPAYGLFIVGCLFGLAYLVGGRTLWLPIVMHAVAIFVTEVMRLYVRYQGPAWLVGYSEWPQCGLIGSIYVLGVGIALVLLV
jgi:membrane protease YdiL (CAAX protease family)